MNSSTQADASLGMEQRYFMKASLEYVLKLQEVQERKKFEFVETVNILNLIISLNLRNIRFY